MKPRREKKNDNMHHFGGDWTNEKLQVLDKYLRAYTTALKNKPSPNHPFCKIYIDAFAGTGSRDVAREVHEHSGQTALFVNPFELEPQTLLDGSARLALKTVPRFDKFVFIERQNRRCEQLENLKIEFPELANDIYVRCGDANQEIQEMCQADWRYCRAVLFLDPYGLQVEWTTIEAIARTRTIDLWLLFPLWMGLNRLLIRSGDIPESWRLRIDALLGTKDWYDAFYQSCGRQRSLFDGGETEIIKKTTLDIVGNYFINRLKTIFPGVSDPSGILYNSKHSPLYLLCFAASNERGAPIALRIANHLLKGLR